MGAVKLVIVETRRITTHVCAKCLQPYVRRVPRDEALRARAPQHIRIGICPSCRSRAKAELEKRLAAEA